MIESLKDFICSQSVNSWCLRSSNHGISFTTSCLSISKAGNFPSFHCEVNQRLNCVEVELLVCDSFWKSPVKSENMLLYIFAHVKPISQFVDYDFIILDVYNIFQFLFVFFFGKRSFSDQNLDFWRISLLLDFHYQIFLI